MISRVLLGTLTLLAAALPVGAQVDQAKAAAYFKEAADLEKEGGRLWGILLTSPRSIGLEQLNWFCQACAGWNAYGCCEWGTEGGGSHAGNSSA